MLRGFFDRYRMAMREARFIRVSLLLSAFLNLVNWGLVAWFVLPRLDADIDFFALHYTVYFGVDRVGPAWHLGITPLLGAVFLAVNLVIALRYYVRDRLISAFVLGLTALFEALLLASSIFVILNNV
jgi:hypothetical protein